MAASSPLDGDVTAKVRIRNAALDLFSRQGIDGTSMREIAAHAGVSLGLVQHHYGTKDGLREAVDHAFVDTFASVFDPVPQDRTPEEMADVLHELIVSTFGSSPALRAYLVRCMLEETPTSHVIFNRFADLVDQVLGEFDAQGRLRPGADREWGTFAAMFLIVGPILLGPHVEERTGLDLFAPDVVRRRVTAHLDLLRHGLFTSPSSASSPSSANVSTVPPEDGRSSTT